MARFEMKVYGLDAIKKKFAAAPQIMTKEAANIIYETAVEIENKAKNRVSVDTGALRSSIRATKLSNGSSMIKAGLSNVSNSKGHLINYAAFVEFGTGQKPNTSYKILNNTSIATYAQEFKGKGKRKQIRTSEPYLFNSTDELLGKMINRIKKIKI
jgi:HK97 gp10 family phage protein